jgi:Protein of unknown function (DUF3987)
MRPKAEREPGSDDNDPTPAIDFPALRAAERARHGGAAPPENRGPRYHAAGAEQAERLPAPLEAESMPEPRRPTNGVRSPGGDSLAWPAPPGPPAYHGLAGRIVDAIDPHTEADRVAILVQVLAAFGNAIGRGPYFAVESSRHYPNLNVVLVGETAKGRKGTSWEHVRRLAQTADEGWANERIISGLSSGEGLIWAVRDPIQKKEPIREKGKITGYQDVLVDEGVSDKRLLVVESEFARVLRVALRDGDTLSTTVREAWDSGRLRILTKNSPAIATDAHISIVGHITKDELIRSLCETEMANGFANRFLWVCVRRSKLLPEGGGALDLGPLSQQLQASLAFTRKLGGRPVSRDGAARELWHEVYAELSAGRPGMAGAVLGRAEAQVMRLALVYALLDQVDAIGAAHLRAALAFWEYVEQSVRYVFGDATGDSVADDILRALRASPDGLTRTELSNHFGRHVSADKLGSALELLQRNGRALAQSESTGGRPVERWRCAGREESETRTIRSGLNSLTSLSSQRVTPLKGSPR